MVLANLFSEPLDFSLGSSPGQDWRISPACRLLTSASLCCPQQRLLSSGHVPKHHGVGCSCILLPVCGITDHFVLQGLLEGPQLSPVPCDILRSSQPTAMERKEQGSPRCRCGTPQLTPAVGAARRAVGAGKGRQALGAGQPHGEHAKGLWA